MHGQCKIYNGPKNPYKKINLRITSIYVILFSLMCFLLGYAPQKTEVFKKNTSEEDVSLCYAKAIY